MFKRRNDNHDSTEGSSKHQRLESTSEQGEELPTHQYNDTEREIDSDFIVKSGPSTIKLDEQLENEPNYDVLVDKLYERTVERKIMWEAEEDQNMFTSSIKGKFKFVIRRIPEHYSYVLTMRNDSNEIIFRISHDNLPSSSSEALLRLYKLAERIARQIDTEVDSAINLLNDLKNDE